MSATTTSVSSSRITLQDAQRAIAAATEEAARNGWSISVAVVDAYGEPIALERQDTATGISPYLAIGKARDAAQPQALLRRICWSDQFIASNISQPEGALPIIAGSRIIGAVGALLHKWPRRCP